MDFAKRNQDMESRYLNGETLQSIGTAYDITRERVRQILAKRGIDPQEGGVALYRRINPPRPKESKRKTPICEPGYHYCKKCGVIDKVENFYYHSDGVGHKRYLHKPCRSEYMKKYISRRTSNA